MHPAAVASVAAATARRLTAPPLSRLALAPLVLALLAAAPVATVRAEPGEAAAATPEPAAASDRPLARFVTEGPAADELQPLLRRVLEAARAVDPLDPEDDERQLRRLRTSAIDVLATEGFFQPQITVDLDRDNQTRYVLRLDPGPRTRVAEVQIRLTGAIEQQPERIRELVEGWELDVGQPFRDPQWSTAKTRLLARVQERDFPAARLVDSAAEIDADEARAVLRLTIDSGPAFTLGGLVIVEEPGKGLKRYDRVLVERFNDIAPGDRYDALRLLELQRKLQSAPYFSSVLVDVPVDPAQPDKVPIRLTLVEAKSKRISTGIGFSTNFGVRVEGLYRQTGIFGYPYTLQTGASWDRKRRLAFSDLLLPPKPNGALDSVGVLGERTDIQDLITRRAAIGVARAHSTSEIIDRDGAPAYDTRLSLKLQRETTERRLSTEELLALRAANQEPEPPFTSDTVTLAYNWTRRTVDSVTDPRRGSVLTLLGAVGVSRNGLSQLLSGTYFYGYGRYVRYLPVFDRHQLILRGELGHVVVDDLRFVPIDYRFRAGGAGSVRGYQYQSLGTRQGSTVIGANSLAIGSAEYVHWITPTWGAAAFYDVGDADDELLKVRWAKGYGLGARWRTVAGPLALDTAYGERDKKWRVHFTIAVAF